MDPSGLERQIAQLHPASFAWALACCRWNAYEAEEVLQSAYVRVLEGQARYGGRSSFKTWLFAVVGNVAAESRRRKWVRDVALARLLHWSAPDRASPAADEMMDAEERGARVRGALGKLALRQREVLDLVFFHGLTIEESAEVMGVALGTARVHYQRGKRRLLTVLAPEDEE